MTTPPNPTSVTFPSAALVQTEIATAVAQAVSNLLNGAPAALDTLKELADALGDDPNFAATLTAQIAAKYTKPTGGIPASDLTAAVQTAITDALSAIRTVNGVGPDANGNISIATGGGTAGVSSFQSRTGAVSLTKPDVVGTGIAAADIGAYAKPAGGIPAADLAAAVQTAITAAGNAATNTLSNVTPTTGRSALGLGSASTHPATDFDPAGAASAVAATAVADLTDATVTGASGQLAVGVTSNVASGGSYTSPPLPGTVGTPAARFAIKVPASATANVTFTYPNSAGTAVVESLLPGSARIYRQKSTSGWGVEAGNTETTALSGIFASAKTLRVPASCNACTPGGAFTSASATGYTFRAPLVIGAAISDVTMRLANWYWDSAGEHPGANTATFKAAIEFGGQYYPLLFNGAQLLTVDPWATIESDRLGIEFAKGDTPYLRLFVNTPSGGTFPWGSTVAGSIAFGAAVANGTYTTGDSCYGTGALGSTSTTTQMPGFIGLYGRPLDAAAPQVHLFVTDSIGAGRNDTINGQVEGIGRNSAGWVQRGLGSGRLAQQTGTPGIAASQIAVKTGHTRIGQVWADKTHGYVCLGTNDINAGRTAAQIIADLQTIAADLRNRGCTRITTVTVPPRTTSTDSWATTTNQTVLATESVRVALNTAIRAGITGFDDYLELADQCETARNSGIWVPGGTLDGLHPNVGTYPLMGTVFSTYLTSIGA